MNRYSAFRLFVEGLRGQMGWTPAWRSPAPKPRYDVIVIGGGGHGLATAYYLAKVTASQRRGAGAGLDGRRQHRAQHHDHPLELLLP